MNKYIAAIAFLLLFSACKTKKELVATKPILQQSEAQQLISKLGQKQQGFNWLSGKIDCSATLKGSKTDFTTNFKIKSDSLVWLSISPALGIELARVGLTKDQVMFLNKFKKEYFVGSYEYLLEFLKIEGLDYCLLQDLLIGRPILLDEEEKWKGETENGFYVLKNIPSKNLRKGYGITRNEDFQLPADSLYLYEEMGGKLERAVKKNKDKDRFLKRYFLDSEFTLCKMIITDVKFNRVLEIYYSNFSVLDGVKYPNRVEVNINDSFESTKFVLDYIKIKSDPQDPPVFKIPESYAPIKP